MKSLRGGNFNEVTVAVQIDLLRLRYGRLQCILATEPVQATPRFNLIPVNCVDLFAGVESWPIQRDGETDRRAMCSSSYGPLQTADRGRSAYGEISRPPGPLWPFPLAGACPLVFK
jgi:hypothetical protein